ncbi:uncharacterized protein LOC107002678 isoform X2 [Solanum pennellii]|uniref:Uncharacterized protein LOC107002678 isoform X2 n=1 Tax=Solanum pennellii TaxID=28526 RepID=A0ABM1UXS7_SOLPN|nr:uncharacterized protein LOC107002678 isoform X2 [Solanum pennellii]
MRIALTGKRKIGFITGAYSRSLYRDELHEQLETCNAIVLSWLMSSVSEDLLSGIVYATNAYTVWADLKEKFDKVNRMRIYQLHREINTLSQGSDSVSTYYTKLKNLWREYLPLVVHVQNPKNMQITYQLRLIQFLSGLNESYEHAKRQILLKGVTHSINQAYAMIIEDELQQQTASVAIVNNVPEPVAMSVNRGSNHNQEGQNHKGRRCEYCQYTGHTKENCYKLIGYPADWKHRKKSGFNNSRSSPMHPSSGRHGYNHSGEANNISKDNYGEASSSHHEVNNAFVARGHAFIDGEYKQIMDMLGKDNKDMKQVNMKGMANCFSTNVASHCWIVDSSVSHHITTNEHLLKNSKCTTSSLQDKVNLPTGDKAFISHIGETCFLNNEVIKDVLCVSEFKFNLLSVSQLTRELSCFVSFYPKFCIFQDLYSGRVKGIGKEEGSMYIFRNDSIMKGKCESQNIRKLLHGYHCRIVNCGIEGLVILQFKHCKV